MNLCYDEVVRFLLQDRAYLRFKLFLHIVENVRIDYCVNSLSFDCLE